jgi:uncharacterized protein YbaR (Trm112 family)
MENQVAEQMACPQCKERDADNLELNLDKAEVRCATCGRTYDISHLVEHDEREWPEHLDNEWAFTTVEHAITFLEGANNGFQFLDSFNACADLYASHKHFGEEEMMKEQMAAERSAQ